MPWYTTVVLILNEAVPQIHQPRHRARVMAALAAGQPDISDALVSMYKVRPTLAPCATRTALT